MKKRDFLQKMGLASIVVTALPILTACSKDDTTTTNVTAGCDGVTSPSETTGPFPTIAPATLVLNDIRSDREGVMLTININIKNANASNALLAGAIVDIWHCDKDGSYSEYGGTGLQPLNYTAVHFLRGRQTTNAAGEVSYISIFPGWYNGRSTHIHVHIYAANGTSLLVTQIAFPEGANSANAIVTTTATGYKGNLTGYTYNASDNVFSDSSACELCTVTGNITDGYVLESEIKVSA